MTPTEEAAQILVRVFEALARQNGKTLSPTTRTDVARACELMASAGEELDTLLEATSSRRSPADVAVADPRFEAWRASRAG